MRQHFFALIKQPSYFSHLANLYKKEYNSGTKVAYIRHIESSIDRLVNYTPDILNFVKEDRTAMKPAKSNIGEFIELVIVPPNLDLKD